MKHKILFTTLVFTLFFISLTSAQSTHKSLDSFFNEIDKNGEINGSVLVTAKGKIVYRKSFGYADIGHQVLNTENTLFQIASVSKIFTAVAVLQLEEQKKLSLADKFAQYFPDFPYPEVTVKQIISNTSGIPDADVFLPAFRQNRDTLLTLANVIPALKSASLPLHFESGERWEYSNMNYTLLALLVEQLSGEKFGEYLSKNIFKPAGMKSSFQKASATNPYGRQNVAHNYAFPFRSSSAPVRADSSAINDYIFHYRTGPSEGASNIYTSATDLANFDRALKKGLLLKRTGPFIPSTRNNGTNVTLRGVGSEIGLVVGDFFWGYGNRISLDSTYGKIVWESGGMPGCTANMISNLTKDQVIIWLNNTTSTSAMNNMFGALDIINDKPAAVKKAKVNLANIYGQELLQSGEDHAFATLMSNKSDTLNYILDMDEMNELGYEFSENNRDTLAFAVFRTAILLFPDNDNLYNSYGEILAKSGKKSEAILMYKRSVLLNPRNSDSVQAVERLEKDK